MGTESSSAEPAGNRGRLSGDKLADLWHWMGRQFLGDLSGDPFEYLRVKRFAKFAQYLRGSNDNEPFEEIGVSMVIERFGNLVCESFLCNVVPVGFFHRASGNTNTCNRPSWTIRALLTRCRIFLLENPLDDKIDPLCAASVAQEKGLLAIADENETIMGNDRGHNVGNLGF